MVYPQFTEINASHKDTIDSITRDFPPYCDYQFSNLLSWSSHKSPTMISVLNNNLVIRMKQYSNNNVITMFIGKNRVPECINEIMKLFPKLERIPQEVVEEINSDLVKLNYSVNEDNCNHDYVLDLNRVADPAGSALKSKRKNVKQFEKLYPNHTIEYFDQSGSDLKNMFEQFFREIAEEKGETFENLSDELEAVHKLLDHEKLFNLSIIGVKNEGGLIGFTINEILKDSGHKTALGCFGKGLRKYRGIYAYLETITARYLVKQGLDYINLEEDMGLPGLKESKRLWRPAKMLKKFVIEKSC